MHILCTVRIIKGTDGRLPVRFCVELCFLKTPEKYEKTIITVKNKPEKR